MKKYQELLEKLVKAIAEGSFQEGERLPSLRALAREHRLARLTVERAFLELEKRGWIETRPGSGSYVTFRNQQSANTEQEVPVWQRPFCGLPPIDRVDQLEFPLHLGAGARDLQPREEILKTLRQELRLGNLDMGYGHPQGAVEFRKRICQLLTSRGLQRSPSSILVTTGSQQAISLIFRTLLKSGDHLALAQPSYGAVIALGRSLGLNLQGIPMDRKGICPHHLEDTLKKGKVRLIYLMPNFQNPSGITMDTQRRQDIMSLAEIHGVPILEDDYLGGLSFQPGGFPCLKALDRRGLVIYVSTFSKILLPGLRLGFLSVEGPVFQALQEGKQREDLASPYFLQQALARYITLGRYQAHLKTLRREYADRLQALLEGLAGETGLERNVPLGGLYLWCRLPKDVHGKELLKRCRRRGLSFAPGEDFFINPQEGRSFLRLNFTQLSREGNFRAGEILRQEIQEVKTAGP